MSNTAGLIILTSIAAIILILASFVTQFLISKRGENKQLLWLNDRIASWWIILSIFFIAVITGKYGVVVLFAICSFAALREFLTLIQFERGDHWSLLTIVFAILPTQFFFVAMNWTSLALVFIPVYGFLLLPVASAFRGTNTEFLLRISQYQWALMLCVYCLSHLPAIIFLEIENYNQNLLLLVYLIFIVEISKASQHIISTLFDARKLAPHISKTQNIAGFWGGIFLASVIGSALHIMTPFGLMGAFAICFATTTIGLCGSLVMTAIKRDRGVRDFGYAVAGHGGFLDGMGALLYAAPIFYHLTRFFWS